MKDAQNRIETLTTVFERWFSDENEYMLRAVHQTVEEGYFSFADVQHALKALKKSLGKETLAEWVERSGLPDEQDARGKNVLCLHAGNLPLVGFQDALAVLLSGARYTGKISRKDPYLLPTFLNEVKKTAMWSSIDVQWSHRLDDFEGMQNHAILFAGSGDSVSNVKAAVNDLNLLKQEGQYLVRTAHFSMAYVDQKEANDLLNLTEAILRYGGKGCRSVAVVVSPFAFDSVKDQLRNGVEEFWADNPQHQKPMPKLRHRGAYNEAVGRNQLWMNDFIIQENGLEFDQDFICYWVQGNEKQARTLAEQFADELQSLYITRRETVIPGMPEDIELELLKTAQHPPVYWCPDGIDMLRWLIVNT